MVAEPQLSRLRRSGQGLRRRWGWALASMVLASGVLTVRAPYDTDAPCPAGGQPVAPTSVRLVPSVVRHQSWVGVPSTSVRLGLKLLACTDGRIVGETLVDEKDLAWPVTQIGIPTRWVATMWLAGRLDEYRTTSRWTVIVDPRTLPSSDSARSRVS